MNFQATSPKVAIALVSALVTFPVHADGPARLSADERAAIQTAAGSAREWFKTASGGTLELIDSGRIKSNEANVSVREFLAQAALTSISIEDAPPAAPANEATTPDADHQASTKPLEVKAGPKDTLISADDGMFFDAEKGVLVYLKNVKLTSPDFDLSGANELKVFLSKKEEKKKAPLKEGDPAPEPVQDEKKDEKKDGKKATPGLFGATGGFGDPEKIIATGAVKITQKAVDGKAPVVASAALLDYNAKTGEIILSGGYPWVQQGATFMRAKEPNLYLRIKKDGSFVTEGPWDMGVPLNASPAPPKPGNKPANP